MDFLTEPFAPSFVNQGQIIIGVDEAGRGCLCGPVYAAAVCFRTDEASSLTKASNSKVLSPPKIYKDSKLLTATQRELLFEDILSRHFVGIGFASNIEVDKINILQATFLAMRRAIENLKENYKKVKSFENETTVHRTNDGKAMLDNSFAGHVVVDGNQLIPGLLGLTQSFLIKGDQLMSEISAASIVAKVSRDRYVDQLDLKFPEYEFRKHKGYGTALHRSKIKELGPCPEHRTTFKGVREFLHIKTQQSY